MAMTGGDLHPVRFGDDLQDDYFEDDDGIDYGGAGDAREDQGIPRGADPQQLYGPRPPGDARGPYAAYAGTLRAEAWVGVVAPLPPRRKSPPPKNVTGRGDSAPTAAQYAEWAAQRGDGNVLVRPAEGYVAIDIDHHGSERLTQEPGKPEVPESEKRGIDHLREAAVELPPTLCSTSRRSGAHAIYRYNDKPGYEWPDPLPDVEARSHLFGYIVAPGSVIGFKNLDGDSTEAAYALSVGDPCAPSEERQPVNIEGSTAYVADLPDEIRDRFMVPAKGGTRERGDGEVYEALDLFNDPDGEPSEKVQEVLDAYLREPGAFAGQGNHHSSVMHVQLALVNLGQRGEGGVRTALNAVQEWFEGYDPSDYFNRALRGVGVDLDRLKRGRETGDWSGLPPVTTIPKAAVAGAERAEAQETPPLVEPDDAAEAWADRYEAQERGRQIARARKARQVEFPPIEALDDLLAEPDEEIRYRVDDLWPAGGRVVLAAPMKSGKTTLRNNLVRALADGDLFLGQFAVEQVAAGESVVVIDNEMSRETTKRWLRSAGIEHVEAVKLVSLRGRAATFDILDPEVRAKWVSALKIARCSVLVFDCLRPVLDALGLDENHQAGQFLVAFDALLNEAGVSEAIIVHHTGHVGDRSRGDSRLRDWPDAEWKIVRDTDDDLAPRYFKAFGRDVDVPQGRLDFDAEARSLSFVVGHTQRYDAEAKFMSVVVDYVRTHPGCSRNQIERGIEGRAETLRAAIARAVTERQIAEEITRSKTSGKVTKTSYTIVAEAQDAY